MFEDMLLEAAKQMIDSIPVVLGFVVANPLVTALILVALLIGGDETGKRSRTRTR